LAGRQAFHTW